jgi:hypothetical protein
VDILTFKRQVGATIGKWLIDPPWRTVRILGAVPVLGVSFTALLVTPLLAKSLFYLRQWLTNFGNHFLQEYEPFRVVISDIASSLHLPMVIQLLAFSALFASAGKLIYLNRCPAYFQVGDSFAQFKRTHPFALSILENEFLSFWNGATHSERHAMVKDLGVTHSLTIEFHNGANWANDIDPLTVKTKLRVHSRKIGGLGEDTMGVLLKATDFGEAVLDTLIDHRDFCRRTSRLCCAWSYYLALALFSWAVLLQVRWVILELL